MLKGHCINESNTGTVSISGWVNGNTGETIDNPEE